ncbi:proteasome subunit alpha [Candidatus Pacearchaeota archaeon ex4484_31]|nr:MAG: proteasome subunit alpha [Candidatus Pacearchaeota archaeon ex4484_31]
MEMEMQHRIMGYDRTATMFSPDGRLLQVEYAEKTVKLGSASIGFLCSDGVVIVADRRPIDNLVILAKGMKVWQVDEHIIASAAGILSDARVLIERAQIVAQQHRVTYDEPASVETVVRDIADIQQSATQYAGARPFGVEIMIAGIDKNDEPKLYVSEVTGNYCAYRAAAIGENDEKIKEMLRKVKEVPTIDKAIKIALNIFKKILGRSFDITRFEAAYVKKKERKAKRIEGKALSKYIR